MSTIKNPHVVFSTKTQGLECLNCGAVIRIDLPLEIRAFCRKAKGFEMMHRDCKKKEAA